MASQTVPPLSNSLHPVFARILAGYFPQAIQSVYFPLRRSEAPIYCQFELPQYAGEKCARVAVVTDLQSETEMCLDCFRRSR